MRVSSGALARIQELGREFRAHSSLDLVRGVVALDWIDAGMRFSRITTSVYSIFAAWISRTLQPAMSCLHLLRLLHVRSIHVVGVRPLALQFRLAVPPLHAVIKPLGHCFVEVCLVDSQFSDDIVGFVTLTNDLRSSCHHLVGHPSQG